MRTGLGCGEQLGEENQELAVCRRLHSRIQLTRLTAATFGVE